MPGLSLGANIRRREFIKLAGGAATSWPLAARAQQSMMPVIGFLGAAAPDVYADRLRAFRRGLKEQGYVEGENVAIEYRWAHGEIGRLTLLATELAHHRVAVIAAGGGTPAALAAKAATSTIPIVFAVAVDPVAAGLVASLNRPGGNLTGVTDLNVEIGPKRLELLHELVPAVTVLGLLVNPSNPGISEPYSQSVQVAARSLGLQLEVLRASTERDFDTVFATLVQRRIAALVISPDVFYYSRAERLAELTVSHAMPAIFQSRAFTAAGGLISYGGDETEYYRQVGIYTGRILKGEKPADLPVQQSTKVSGAKKAGVLPLSVFGALLVSAARDRWPSGQYRFRCLPESSKVAKKDSF